MKTENKELPVAIREQIAKTLEVLVDRPKLANMFSQCYPNTLLTTTQQLEDGTSYVFTGDIPAMWLRDSTAQVRHYIPLASNDSELQEIIEGLICRQFKYIAIDPYANAFNREENGQCWEVDETERNPWVWERKYEIDSLFLFSMSIIVTASPLNCARLLTFLIKSQSPIKPITLKALGRGINHTAPQCKPSVPSPIFFNGIFL